RRSAFSVRSKGSRRASSTSQVVQLEKTAPRPGVDRDSVANPLLERRERISERHLEESAQTLGLGSTVPRRLLEKVPHPMGVVVQPCAVHGGRPFSRPEKSVRFQNYPLLRNGRAAPTSAFSSAASSW